MVGVMLLMAGCTTDDAVRETTSEGAIPISFGFKYDEEEGNNTRAGHQGAMNIEDLYATGFGVMASVSAGNGSGDNKPDLMYNQEVKFTFVGDVNPKTGYWSYQPLKYWPSSTENCYISAYAPYVEPSELTGLPDDATGIVGISENNEEPYITYRRCTKPADVVDLLWCYEDLKSLEGKVPAGGMQTMKMRHALARLEIKVALATDPGTTKVLIEEISIAGTMNKTAKLKLNAMDSDKHPEWVALDTEERTIKIKNADNDPKSYGIIDSQVRYIEGLPYAWQPDGLTTTAQNALSTGDRQTYIYLIPQENWSVTVQVKYKKWVNGADEQPTSGTKSVKTEANPLKGNTPYTLNITLSGV